MIREAKARAYRVLEVQNRPYMMAALRSALPGVKLALHLHNDPQTMDGSRSPGERRKLLELCDVVYCVSRFIRAQFLAGVDDPQGKVGVIHNGVEANLSAAPKQRIVAFAGRVIAIKGVAELIQAFAAANLPDWKLVVAGDDPDGLVSGPRSRVAFEAASLGARLVLRGQVSHAEAMALFASAQIAAVPSMWDDPCPRSAIEALASGCALIATERGGLKEIADGAGVFVEPENTASFATELRRLCGDDAWRTELQARAIAKAREMFDIRAVTAKLDDARETLLKGP